jgi:hypothetical protein
LGSKDLAAASGLHPQVFWADGLEQLERDDLGQISFGFAAEDEKPQATLTQPEVRAKLRPVLKAGFHVVVANPPYITEKDAQRRSYHREMVGKKRRYVSASGTYSLGNPFTERMFQLCVEGGYVGDFNANSFMKREFGKSLIEEVLPRYRLTKVIDTSGAYFPGYGTPTVLLFGRRLRPSDDPVLVVGGKRGEPGRPQDAAQGLVWTSIVVGHTTPGYESDYLSVSEVAAVMMREHPWSIGGGGAGELKSQLSERHSALETVAELPVGRGARTGEDEAFAAPSSYVERAHVREEHWLWFLRGEDVRDWGAQPSLRCLYPYQPDSNRGVVAADDPAWRADLARLWPYRAGLASRSTFQGRMSDAGREWFEYMQYTTSAHATSLSIAFAEVATHNHFVLDRGGKVFKQTAPVIKLPPGATEEEHLALLGQLNSSTACFWLKQACQNKGLGGRGSAGLNPHAWEMFFQFNGANVQSFPLAGSGNDTSASFARELDSLAERRASRSAYSVLSTVASAGAAALRAALDHRRSEDEADLYRMVGMQEELDWHCYRIYGLDDSGEGSGPDPSNAPSLRPGTRPFEIRLATEAPEECRSTEDGKTGWFERHGWTPSTSLDDVPVAWRSVTEARLARTSHTPTLQLIEQPQFKRRWYRPDFRKGRTAAMRTWLADRLEEASKASAAPFTPRQLAAALQDDPALEAVATLYAGQGFDLDALVGTLLFEESVPNAKHHVYKAKSLAKRAAWEKTWRLQHEEDAWDAQKARHDAAIAQGIAPANAPPLPKGQRPVPPVPPKYTSADFLRSEAWQHRGKLDVPKERFVAFTEVPEALNHAGPLYGWAGWTHRKRAEVLMALDEQAEHAGAALPERYALLYAVQSLLPYVRWDESAHGLADEYQGILGDLLGDAA